MNKIVPIALILLALSFTGCDKRREDLTKGSSATCEVHHTRMVKSDVPIEYGLIRLNEYGRSREAASTNIFPHAQECVLGGCIVGTATQAVSYVCRDCQKALQKWELARESHK